MSVSPHHTAAEPRTAPLVATHCVLQGGAWQASTIWRAQCNKGGCPEWNMYCWASLTCSQ